jgi:hypothetical protein
MWTATNISIIAWATVRPLDFRSPAQGVIDAAINTITQKGVYFSFPHELDYKVKEAMQRLVPSIDLIRHDGPHFRAQNRA